MSSRETDAVELQASAAYHGNDDADDGQDFRNNSCRSGSVYETRYQKSLRHYLTREALPKESHYRNLDSIIDGSARPTLDDLHDNTYRERQKIVDDHEEEVKNLRGKVIKFGWLEGVFMRCLLNIWGVMLFLRVGWVVGQAGIISGFLIVLLANAVTVITAVSMSAVATNGQIKAGGIYYMISRSLGPEFGASIGLMFTLANSIAAATYIIGFVNGVQEMCADYFAVDEIIPGAGGGVNDVRILGVITLIGVLALAIVGMDWVTRVQMGLLFLLIGSQIDFIIGAFLGPVSTSEEARGFVGFSGEVFNKNVYADYRFFQSQQSFFSVFGVFFPAVTGIVAGANLSGDLKDPGIAIPKGTLLAIAITFVTYVVYPIMIAGSCVRDAFGNETLYLEYQDNSTSVYDNPTFNDILCPYDENGQSTCKYGTANDFKIMEIISVWGPLIYMGCYAATLSSAIASLVGAPRVLQALAKDKLYPLIHVFAKGYGANNDPVRGYILVFILSFICIMIGELNAVSTLLTNFFLAAYALINFSCFHASFIKSPGWRPAFKYYNLWVSLIGGLLCLIVMFLIDWITALCTFVISVVLFKYVSYRKPDVNWGSSTQAQSYISALKSTLELIYVEEHVKNFRPQILLLSGNPAHRPALVDFAFSLTKNISFLACANVIKGGFTHRSRMNMSNQAYKWMSKHKIKAFYPIVEGTDLEQGSKSLYQLCGLGKLRPNMVLLGYKSDWMKCDRLELKAYFNTLHEALDMYFGVAILRVPEGLDYSHIIDDDDSQMATTETELSSPTSIAESGVSNKQMTSQLHQDLLNLLRSAKITRERLLNGDGNGSEPPTPPGSPEITERSETVEEKLKRRLSHASLYLGIGGSEIPKDVLNNITRFQRKQKKGTIDVWWLYDDGGLTLLLPYILTTRSQWAGCKLRVFALANRKDELDLEQRSMANLLNKFRIDFSDMIIIPDMARRASEASRIEFQELIKNFMTDDTGGDISKEDEGLVISEAERLGQREKINRHIRLRELLLENSRDASLIVMTLPMPRKNTVSAPLYMAWLETLTKDMPPFLLIRGNQTSVLTFYS